jgi:magnesium transporter
VTDPNAPKPVIRALAYSADDFVEKEITDISSLNELQQQWPMVWVNVDGLGDARTLQALGELFSIHRLALEDVVNVGQRAKAEIFDEHIFLILRMPGQGSRTKQVSVFVGKGYVLSFQETPGDCFDLVRQRIRDGKGRIRHRGSDYLTYALADAVIDAYFPTLEEIADRLDGLETEVFSTPEKDTVPRIQHLKASLRELWRTARPHRDMLNVLQKEDTPFMTEGTRVYLRDAQDHTAQVTDLADSYREAAADLLGAYLSSASNRMNEVMKLLTIISAIFIPLSFVAGLYGMNFDPSASRFNMPELSWTFGYPFALGIMFTSALVMLIYFWRKGWFR